MASMGKVLAFRLPNAGQIARCCRCGDPCKVAEEKRQDAQLLRVADKPEGQCVNCAVAEWFYVTGSREICPDPSALRHPHIQEMFARIMATGKADAKPAEINWEHVVAHWDLPFKIGKRKTIDPVANPSPPVIRRRRR